MNHVTEEVWLPIKGYEGLYEVSNTGKVKALERVVENNGGMQRKHERILQPRNSRGYQQVTLCKKGKTWPVNVHRLVAMTFIANPEGKPFVDHIDTNPSNNHVSNLRWATCKENANNLLTRAHISESKIGHEPYVSPEVSRVNIRKAHAAIKGKKLSDEHRANLSRANKNSENARRTSMENLQKAILANTGKHRSDATKQKLSQSHKGLLKGKSWIVVNGKRVWIDRKEPQNAYA